MLLIEAGPDERSLLKHMPKGFGKLLSDPRHTWHLAVTVGPASGRSQEMWVRGKMLGAPARSTALSSCAAIPLTTTNGASGWGWPAVGKAFRSIEKHALGESVQGALKVASYAQCSVFGEAVIRGCESLGLQRKELLERAWELAQSTSPTGPDRSLHPRGVHPADQHEKGFGLALEGLAAIHLSHWRID